jgi:hypothetical protein
VIRDLERDAFMQTLVEVAGDVGWQLLSMREHQMFKAMVIVHGEDQVRRWLLLYALRTVRHAELSERLRRANA